MANQYEIKEGKSLFLLVALAFINMDQGMIRFTELLLVGLRSKMVLHSCLYLRLGSNPLPTPVSLNGYIKGGRLNQMPDSFFIIR